jgi:hypothetical protein
VGVRKRLRRLKQRLNPVALPAERRVMFARLDPMAALRNHHNRSLSVRQRGQGLGLLGDLGRGQAEGERLAQAVGQPVDLGTRAASASSSKAGLPRPLLQPEASCDRARTIVVSGTRWTGAIPRSGPGCPCTPLITSEYADRSYADINHRRPADSSPTPSRAIQDRVEKRDANWQSEVSK